MASGVQATEHSVADGHAPVRTIIVFQLLLAAVMLLATALVVLSGMVQYPALLVISFALVFLTCAAALLIPWRTLPRWLAVVLPTLDAVAIALLRESSPGADLEILWAFPAMWVAWSFGLGATITAITLITLTQWILDALRLAPLTPSSLIVPVTIAVLATIAHLMARLTRAQRDLLQRQSSALQRAVERAHRQEGLVTDVLDAVDFEVVVYATDGTVAIFNEAHTRMQQVREDAGQEIYTADGITTISRAQVPTARAQRGQTFEDELHWYGAPGRDRKALTTTARRLQDWRGQDTGIVVVTRNVTAEVLAVRAREDLVASVSHELRTPLTSILGFLELAAGDDDIPAGTRRGLQIAERNAERLMDLLADILAASADASAGVVLTVDPEPARLSDVVESAVEAAQEGATSRHIHIDATGVERTWARIDIHRIRQVVDNLLSNAIKYGREAGRIDVGTTSDGTHAWVVVRDDGTGVSEEELPLLFDRFFRSGLVRNTATHGSGLGLAISRDIARSHGGDITVSSAPEQGTTFVVRLPAAEPVATADDGATTQHMQVTTVPGTGRGAAPETEERS